jgi:hypothetical protein
MLQPHVRGQPREQHSVGREHAPQFLQHARKVRLVRREVQDRAADHGVHAGVGKGHAVQLAYLKVTIRIRKLGSKRGGERLHARHGGRIAIEAETRKAAPEKVHEIPAIPAAGIEHTTPPIEAAAQQLIE